MADPLLDAATDLAFAKLQRAGGDPRNLDEPFRTLAIVCAAQGVIDNGGLRYFFENNWPGQPPYALFAQAYRNIGAAVLAQAIEEAAAAFGFPHPERHEERRHQCLLGAEGNRIAAIDQRREEDVWTLLAAYARAHRKALRKPWWRFWR